MPFYTVFNNQGEEHKASFDIALKLLEEKKHLEATKKEIKKIKCRLCNCDTEHSFVQVCDVCYDKFENLNHLENYLKRINK